ARPAQHRAARLRRQVMRLSPFIAFLALVMLHAAPGAAQEPPEVPPDEPPLVPELPEATPGEIPPPDVRLLTRADVEAWLAGFMPYALAKGVSASAAVVVARGADGANEQGLCCYNL